MERTERGNRSRVSVEEATRVTEAVARRERWSWAEAEIWTDRMLAALENGVKGDKWFSLMDKVYAPKVLRSAWDHQRWPNKYFAKIGLLSVSAACQHARRSR